LAKRRITLLSLDIEVYTNAASTLADIRVALPSAERWEDFGGELAYEGDGWQVLVTEPEPIDRRRCPRTLQRSCRMPATGFHSPWSR